MTVTYPSTRGRASTSFIMMNENMRCSIALSLVRNELFAYLNGQTCNRLDPYVRSWSVRPYAFRRGWIPTRRCVGRERLQSAELRAPRIVDRKLVDQRHDVVIRCNAEPTTEPYCLIPSA
jgi:hypothetical protein